MQPFILQDWTTIRSSTTTVIQGESGWLDLAPFQDVVFWVDLREQSGSSAPSLLLQTSPVKDDAIFQAMVTIVLNAVSNPYPVRLASATIPLARYVRWQLSGPSGTWDATFRVLAAANTLAT
jgi:hypothetical protein